MVTNDDHIAGLVRSMRSQGRPITGLWFEHEHLGYNYRVSELHAALGREEMNRIDEIVCRRQRVAEMCNSRLSGIFYWAWCGLQALLSTIRELHGTFTHTCWPAFAS